MYSKEQIEETISKVLLDKTDLSCTVCFNLTSEIMKELATPTIDISDFD